MTKGLRCFTEFTLSEANVLQHDKGDTVILEASWTIYLFRTPKDIRVGCRVCYNYLQMNEYFVYILANKSGMLYTGVTNDLVRRIYDHKNKKNEGFTKKYNIDKLVYFESTNDVTIAIAREKQIKGMLRSKKVELIKAMNLDFIDLSDDWF